jgi:hypothetical protein
MQLSFWQGTDRLSGTLLKAIAVQGGIHIVLASQSTHGQLPMSANKEINRNVGLP